MASQVALPTTQSILYQLPTELLLKIKLFIPRDDVRSHLSFSRACPRITSLYETAEEEKFWRQWCWQSGLGLLQFEDPGGVCWRDIAANAFAHAESCRHPLCGESLLSRNREL